MKKLKSGSGARNFSNQQALKNYSKRAKSALTSSPVSEDNANYALKPAQLTRCTGALAKWESPRICAFTAAPA